MARVSRAVPFWIRNSRRGGRGSSPRPSRLHVCTPFAPANVPPTCA